MSVFSIRLFQPSTKIGDNEIFRDLQKLEELLAFQPTDYNGIIVMARAIVDAAGKSRPVKRAVLEIAEAATTTAIAVATQMGKIAPEDLVMDHALLPFTENINELMITIHALMLRPEQGTSYGSRKRFKTSIFSDKYISRLNGALETFMTAVQVVTKSDVSKTENSSVDASDGFQLTEHDIMPSGATNAFNYKNTVLQRVARSTFARSDKSFWSNTFHTSIDGQAVVVKHYPADAKHEYEHALWVLKNTRHTFLPSLFGHTPPAPSEQYMALSMGNFIPFREWVRVHCYNSPESALVDVWRMLITMRSTAEHLFFRNLVDNSNQLREMLESSVVENGKIVLAPVFERNATDSQRKPLKLGFVDQLDDEFDFMFQGVDAREPVPFGQMPRILNPLRYGLLHTPHSLLTATSILHRDLGHETIAYFLKKLRPGATSTLDRSLNWPIAYDLTQQVAVGDVGVFSSHVDGTAVFKRLTNVQANIGGFLLDSDYGEKEPHNTEIRTGIWELGWDESRGYFYHRWNRSIPLQVAYAYFCGNAFRLSIIYGVAPTDLVLVTRVMLDMTATHADESVQPFVQFDSDGRLLGHCWARSDETDGLIERMTLEDPGVDIRPLGADCINYLQLEQDEVLSDGDQRHYSDANILHLGDAGFFTTLRDGERRFQKICDAFELFGDIRVTPWYGNLSVLVKPGVWKYSPASLGTGSEVLLTWTFEGDDPTLPADLAQMYLESFVSPTKLLDNVFRKKPDLVSTVVHQVCAIVPAQYPDRGRPQLLVHFTPNGRLSRAFWCYLIEGDVYEPIEDGVVPAILRPSLAFDVQDSRSAIVRQKRYDDPDSYKEIKDPSYQFAWADKRQVKVGDVGLMRNDMGLERGFVKEATLPEEVVTSQVHHFWEKGRRGCEEVAPGLWKSPRMVLDSADKNLTLHFRWVHEVVSLMEDSSYNETDDLFINSKNITDVYATATYEAIHRHRTGLYLYILFAPDGQVYTYWTKHEHDSIDLRVLTQLDLDHWTLSGCKNRVVRRCEHRHLGEFRGLLGTKAEHENLIVGRAMGDIGYMALTEDGMEGNQVTWLTNIAQDLGDLRITTVFNHDYGSVKEVRYGVIRLPDIPSGQNSDTRKVEYAWEATFKDEFLQPFLANLCRGVALEFGVQYDQLVLNSGRKIQLHIVTTREFVSDSIKLDVEICKPDVFKSVVYHRCCSDGQHDCTTETKEGDRRRDWWIERSYIHQYATVTALLDKNDELEDDLDFGLPYIPSNFLLEDPTISETRERTWTRNDNKRGIFSMARPWERLESH